MSTRTHIPYDLDQAPDSVQEIFVSPKYNQHQSRYPAVKQDLRAQRTRASLVSALFKLLADKPLESITVTELTQAANVNRATFYAHFKRVPDILQQIKNDLCQMIYKEVGKHRDSISDGNMVPLITDIVSYVDENADGVFILLNGLSDGAFFVDIMDVLRATCTDAILQSCADYQLLAVEHPYECDYHFSFISGAIACVLRRWFENGRRESREDITKLLITYAQSVPLKKFIRPGVPGMHIAGYAGIDPDSTGAGAPVA